MARLCRARARLFVWPSGLGCSCPVFFSGAALRCGVFHSMLNVFNACKAGARAPALACLNHSSLFKGSVWACGAGSPTVVSRVARRCRAAPYLAHARGRPA